MHGYHVFIDFQNINSGNFERAILDNIRTWAPFIVILIPSAFQRCKNPGDWLRREIETAMDEKRNIAPLMMEGFDFGSPLVKEAPIGRLAALSDLNALSIPDDYPFEVMDRLRVRYLNIALSDVALPTLQKDAQEITIAEKSAANEAAPISEEKLTAQTWFEKAYVYQEARNLEGAFRCYSQAILLDPHLDAAQNNLGLLLRDLKRNDEAEAAFRKGIELNPCLTEAYSNLGNLLRDLRSNDEAEAALRKAIELNPSLTEAYNNLVILLRLIGRIEDAMPLLEKLIEIAPEDFNPYLALVSISKQLGKTISPEHVAKARQFLPEDDWYNRACLESVCDNFDVTFEYLEKAAQIESFNPSWAWDDPDLQWLRNDPGFSKIMGSQPK